MYYIFKTYVLYILIFFTMKSLAVVTSVPIFYDNSTDKIEEVFALVLGYKVRLDDILTHPENLQEKRLALVWHRYSWAMARRRIRNRSVIS